MPEYVTKEAVKQAMRSQPRGILFTEWELDQVPSVDAVEVVHARWKYDHKHNIAVCTNCSFERDLDENFGRAVSCPNCGAEMDGGE